MNLWKSTIWAKGAIPADELKYAGPLKRFVFPVFDVIMLVVGIRSMFVGIPSIDFHYPPLVAWVLYATWAILAFVCLVGAIFPRLLPLEIGGKIALFSILATYLIALRGVPAMVDGARDAVSGLVLAAMLIPALRLWILGYEIRPRKAS